MLPLDLFPAVDVYIVTYSGMRLHAAAPKLGPPVPHMPPAALPALKPGRGSLSTPLWQCVAAVNRVDLPGQRMLTHAPCCAVLIAEPVDVVQPTCIAALNLNYPGSRLTVHVLDDGNSNDIKCMVEQLQLQAR